jgi:hypothetical protein
MPLLSMVTLEEDDEDVTEADQGKGKSDEEHGDGADVVGTWLEVGMSKRRRRKAREDDDPDNEDPPEACIHFQIIIYLPMNKRTVHTVGLSQR